jgi:hypothetical protein
MTCDVSRRRSCYGVSDAVSPARRFMPMPEGTPRIVGLGLTIHDMRVLLEVDPATLYEALMEASTRVLPDVEAPDTVRGLLAQP